MQKPNKYYKQEIKISEEEKIMEFKKKYSMISQTEYYENERKKYKKLEIHDIVSDTMKTSMRKCAILYNNGNFKEVYDIFKKIIIVHRDEEPTGLFFDKIIYALSENSYEKFMKYRINNYELYEEIYKITDTARKQLIELLNNKNLFIELLNEMYQRNIRCVI